MASATAPSQLRLSVRVALPVPVDTLFDYAVPDALEAGAQPGFRVLVPFGSRRLTGVVVTRQRDGSERTLREIERVVDTEPVLSPAMLDILREEAAAVLCPLGVALATAVPPGSAPRAVTRWALCDRGREALERGALPSPTRDLCAALADEPRTAAALARRHPRAAARLRALEKDGLVTALRELAPPRAREAEVTVVRVAPGVDLEQAERTLARAPKQAALLRRLAEAGPSEQAELSRDVRGAAGFVRALHERGLVQVTRETRRRDVLGIPLEPSAPVTLTEDQVRALEPIRAAVNACRPERFLLHGVTGSGKTEVYLQAVAEALARGRQALVLVPEITLTHQILARVRARFGDNLAVLHSGLSQGERLEQWRRLRAGHTPIAVGARSALFAPLENLGVIVIDEEHDGAYKNEEGFRYHARDLAWRRARAAGCPVILGSATPAVETRFAADRGEFGRLQLPQRVAGRPLPAVEVVDLEQERAHAPRGRKLVLGRTLRAGLEATFREGGQAILFLNRRGFSTKVLCFDCGHAERCKHCDIALVYHADEQRLRCHYCGFHIPPPEICSNCGAPDTALLGIGTERVVEDLRTLFPDARIARLDRDTASRRGATEKILRGLREGDLDVVVGTQMVAKGHDFPGVLLVGVVLADLGLHLPDFRAAERTFQLLTQVAGRAGRGHSPGQVVVQTFVPDHYAVRAARTHDYEAFYMEELGQRAALGYPPFGRLVHVLVSGPDAAETEAAGEKLAAQLEAHGDRPALADVECLGPVPAPLARLRDRYRFQLLLKGADAEHMHEAARRLVSVAAHLPAPLRAKVDVNPINML